MYSFVFALKTIEVESLFLGNIVCLSNLFVVHDEPVVFFKA